MVNYSYKKIEKLLDNLPNWYKEKIDPKILKSLMQRSEVFPPAMTWNNTLGNIEVLDRWRKSIGYKLPQETI